MVKNDNLANENHSLYVLTSDCEFIELIRKDTGHSKMDY